MTKRLDLAYDRIIALEKRSNEPCHGDSKIHDILGAIDGLIARVAKLEKRAKKIDRSLKVLEGMLAGD